MIKHYVGWCPEEILSIILLTFPLPQEEWEVLRDPFCSKLKVHSLDCADLNLYWICDDNLPYELAPKLFPIGMNSEKSILKKLEKLLENEQQLPNIQIKFFLPKNKKAQEYGPKRNPILLKNEIKKSSFEITIDDSWKSQISLEDIIQSN